MGKMMREMGCFLVLFVCLLAFLVIDIVISNHF